MDIKLSVIIPVYEVAEFLEECVNSVTSQEPFKQGMVEVILVDDGSPDNSGEICDKLAKENENITVVHQKNGGLSNARNTGIKIAKGEYIQFLDSDDTLCVNCLSNVFLKFGKEPDVVILNYVEKDLNSQKISNVAYHLDEQILLKNTRESLLEYLITDRIYDWYAWLNVVKKDYLLKNNFFFMEGKYFEDVLWTPSVLFNAKKVCYIDEPSYCYLTNRSGSITRQVTKQNYEDKIFVLQFTKEFCKKNKLSKETENRLISNLIRIYISLLADAWLFSSRERNDYLRLLKEFSGALKYSRLGYARILYKIKILIGIRGISFILYLRAQYVRKSREV